MMNLSLPPSAKPQLLRAAHEWCTEHGLTPYLMVAVDASVSVPMDFVKDGQIVLNTSYDATGSLQMGNDFIGFKARFGGKARDIHVPVHRVMGLFARETGEGVYFEVSELPLGTTAPASTPASANTPASDEPSQLHPLMALVNRDNKDKHPEQPSEGRTAPLPKRLEGVSDPTDSDEPPPPKKPGAKPFLVRVK